MSAHVLSIFLNELEKKVRCKALSSILSVFPNEFNNFNNTGARVQDSVYQPTLKSHFISKFCTKTSRFRHYVICEQQRCRSACASAQSDQHICCSLLR